MLNSSFCLGKVSHQRFFPKQYGFQHNIALPLLNLDELPHLNRFSPWLVMNKKSLRVSVHEDDYLKQSLQPGESLKQRAARLYEENMQQPFSGSILMLANWRFLNVVFNPLTLFFYFSRQGKLEALLAEVSNTPWNQRYLYWHVLDPDETRHQWVTNKEFHVSPFHPMDMEYHWSLTINDKKINFSLTLMHREQCHFSAAFHLSRRPATPACFRRWIMAQPLASIQTLAQIYWHALKLYFKRIPIYNHPDKSNEET